MPQELTFAQERHLKLIELTRALLRQLPDERKLLLVFVDAKAVGEENIPLHDAAQCCFIVFSLHDEGIFEPPLHAFSRRSSSISRRTVTSSTVRPSAPFCLMRASASARISSAPESAAPESRPHSSSALVKR